MHHLLDILASGVHDAKNQLFVAETLIGRHEAEQHIDLSEARYAIEAAADRLSRTLTAYHLMRRGAALAVVPTVVEDICGEVALAQRQHLAHGGIALEVGCTVRDEWPLDRDLVTDIINNAVQNAGRYARSRVRLSASDDGDGLLLRVEDDGPGFSDLAAGIPTNGTGLLVAERLAALHVRHGRAGSLRLGNGGELGGALFELRLP